jgi:hypothetical protein
MPEKSLLGQGMLEAPPRVINLAITRLKIL